MAARSLWRARSICSFGETVSQFWGNGFAVLGKTVSQSWGKRFRSLGENGFAVLGGAFIGVGWIPPVSCVKCVLPLDRVSRHGICGWVLAVWLSFLQQLKRHLCHFAI